MWKQKGKIIVSCMSGTLDWAARLTKIAPSTASSTNWTEPFGINSCTSFRWRPCWTIMTTFGCSTVNWCTIEINVAVEKLNNRVSMPEEVIHVVQRNMAFMVGGEKGFIMIYSGTIDGAWEAFLNGVHSILMEDCKSLAAGVNKIARVDVAQEMFDEMPHELSDSQAIIKFSLLR